MPYAGKGARHFYTSWAQRGGVRQWGEPAWLALRGRVWQYAPNANALSFWEEPWRDWLIRTSPKAWVRKVRLISSEAFGSSVQNSSTSLTVPAGTELAVMGVIGWNGSGDPFPGSTVTLGGQNMTNAEVAVDNTHMMGQISFLENPPTGSQTLAWNWGAALTEGACYTVAYFDGVKRPGAEFASGQAQEQAPVALGAVARGDLCVGICGTGSGVAAPNLEREGQQVLPSIADTNNARIRMAWKLGASTFLFDADAADDEVNIAVAFSAQPLPKYAHSRSSLGSPG